MNYWLLFLTGLTTGGISCAAIQGGLLAGSIANQATKKPVIHIGSFLIAKLFIHTIAGFLLGLAGSAFQINVTVMLVFQGLVALYLIATALNLLEAHPIFRFVVIKPPKFALKLSQKTSQTTDWFAPALLGALTIFIPCGVTQAIMLSAVGNADPVSGALALFFFVLGTFPLFILIGLAATSLSSLWRRRLNTIAALVLFFLGMSSVNGILTVLDSPISIQGIKNTYAKLQSYESGQIAGASTVPIKNGSQQVTIDITPEGYQPDYIRVKKGIPVKLTLTTKENYTCANYFIFNEFNISARMQPSETRVFNFIPQKTGRFSFSCSMGMYGGVMEVI